MVKEYWLKMNDQLVAEIYHDEDTNLLSMEIINPDLFPSAVKEVTSRVT